MIRALVLRTACSAAFLLFTGRAACAAVATPSPTPTPTPGPEIVRTVTSDRAETTLRNTTRTTFVVTREDIQRHGYRTIGDAIAPLPGVEVERYGTIGQNVSYGIRGSSSSQVLVLIDGLPAPGTLANSVQMGTMSVSGVRRIEVVEGGGSTLYGSGAIGGIVNIITDGKSAPSYAQASYGTFGDREIQAQYRGLSYGHTVATNTFGLPASSSFGMANPTTRDNSAFNGTTLRYGGDRRIGSLDASLRLSFESDSLGAAGAFPYLSETSRENDVNQFGTFSLAHRGAASNAVLQIGAERQQLLFACDAATDANCYLQQPSFSTESRTFGTFRNVVEHASARTIYGIDLSQGHVREDAGDGSAPLYAPIAQTAAYVQHNVLTRAGAFYAGLRAERDGSLGGEYSPSLGARLPLSASVTLRANAATAFRAPNASELYFPGYGNPNLAAERARVADLSVEDASLAGGATAGWFANDTRNLIVSENVGTVKIPQYEAMNVDVASIRGLTLEASTRPVHGMTARLSVTDLYRAVDVSTGARLPNDPVFATSLLVDVSASPRSRFDGAGIALNSAGSRGPAYDGYAPAFFQSGPYTTLDAYARLRLAPHAVVALRGYNLGNERYAQVYGYPMPGRTFVVELSAK